MVSLREPPSRNGWTITSCCWAPRYSIVIIGWRNGCCVRVWVGGGWWGGRGGREGERERERGGGRKRKREDAQKLITADLHHTLHKFSYLPQLPDQFVHTFLCASVQTQGTLLWNWCLFIEQRILKIATHKQDTRPLPYSREEQHPSDLAARRRHLKPVLLHPTPYMRRCNAKWHHDDVIGITWEGDSPYLPKSFNSLSKWYWVLLRRKYCTLSVAFSRKR